MRTHITTRRAAGAAAVTAVAGLLAVTPAFAQQDPGGRPDGSNPQYGRTYPTDIARDNAKQMQNQKAEELRNKAAVNDTRKGGTSVAPAPGPAVITLDSTSVEYLQIGLGALAGIAVVVAVAAGVSARHHRHTAHLA